MTDIASRVAHILTTYILTTVDPEGVDPEFGKWGFVIYVWATRKSPSCVQGQSPSGWFAERSTPGAGECLATYTNITYSGRKQNNFLSTLQHYRRRFYTVSEGMSFSESNEPPGFATA